MAPQQQPNDWQDVNDPGDWETITDWEDISQEEPQAPGGFFGRAGQMLGGLRDSLLGGKPVDNYLLQLKGQSPSDILSGLNNAPPMSGGIDDIFPISPLIEDVKRGDIGAGLFDAGMLGLSALGLKQLPRAPIIPKSKVPQVLPKETPAPVKQPLPLPAKGETSLPNLSATGPFHVGQAGVANPEMAYPAQIINPYNRPVRKPTGQFTGVIEQVSPGKQTIIPGEIAAQGSPMLRPGQPKITSQIANLPGGEIIDPPFTKKVNSGKAPTPKEQASAVAQAKNINAAASKLPEGLEKEGLYRKTHNFMRTVLTSMDLSAPRQAMGMVTRPEFYTNLSTLFRTWGSKRATDLVRSSIINDPSGYFKPTIVKRTHNGGSKTISFAEDVGLDLSDITIGKEEIFRSSWAEKIPLVERSQRSFTSYLNKIRADVFKKLWNQSQKIGRNSREDARAIAKAINISTGRGSYGKLEQSATAMKVLGETFFAPKYLASRAQMYSRVLNPKTYSSATNPIVRKEALRSLLGLAGTNYLLGELAKGMGAIVVDDPRSSDFRKIRIGNTRLDFMGGAQQFLVAATKFASGKQTSTWDDKTRSLSEPGFGGATRQDIVQRFISSKLAPVPSLVWSWMGTKEFDGTPFEIKQALLNRTVPIVMQDLYELSQEDPELMWLAGLPVMGAGMQTYGR